MTSDLRQGLIAHSAEVQTHTVAVGFGAPPPPSPERHFPGRATRVLFVAHDSGLYGAQRCLLDLLAHLDRSRTEPHVVVPAEGPFTDVLRDLAIPFTQRLLVRWVKPREQGPSNTAERVSFMRGLRSRVWAIGRLVQRHGIDLVYSNTVTTVEGALAARVCKVPHVWHVHELITANRELSPLFPAWIISKMIYRLSRSVVVNSAYTARGHRYDLGDRKIQVVYNGIDLKRVSYDAAEHFVSPLAFNPSIRYVSIVGALHPRKGIENFLAAASLLRQMHRDVEFLVIGDGSSAYVTQVKAKANQLGLLKTVHFMGWRSDVHSLLRQSRVLVVAAEQEPFGLTVIEAMAAGVPVVATRSGGPEEILTDGVSGLLVPVGSPQALATGICRVLQDSVLANAIAEHAARAVSERFTVAKYTTAIEDVIASAR